MKRTEKPPLRRSSMVRHILLLVLAWLWAGAVVVVCFGYHLTQAGSQFLVANGHTYYTHPPALSLSQQDPVSAKIITASLALTVLIGTIDLLVRLARRMTGPGIASITVGVALILFSLGGLLWVLLGMAGTGLLIVLSGLAMKPTAAGPADTTPATEVAAAWYPDPTGRHDLRYWDGGAWSSHVATAGQVSVVLDPLIEDSPVKIGRTGRDHARHQKMI